MSNALLVVVHLSYRSRVDPARGGRPRAAPRTPEAGIFFGLDFWGVLAFFGFWLLWGPGTFCSLFVSGLGPSYATLR